MQENLKPTSNYVNSIVINSHLELADIPHILARFYKQTSKKSVIKEK